MFLPYKLSYNSISGYKSSFYICRYSCNGIIRIDGYFNRKILCRYYEDTSNILIIQLIQSLAGRTYNFHFLL